MFVPVHGGVGGARYKLRMTDLDEFKPTFRRLCSELLPRRAVRQTKLVQNQAERACTSRWSCGAGASVIAVKKLIHIPVCNWGIAMFNVICDTPNGLKTRQFYDKPSALNYAVQAVYRLGKSAIIFVENEGGIVFAHKDIVRVSECVRA